MQHEVKLCKDCKYYSADGTAPCGLKIPQCQVSRLLKIDLVEGKHKHEITYCINQRGVGGRCKPEGVLFEQRITFWCKLKNLFKLN